MVEVDPEVSAADAAILLDIEVRQRVIKALADVLVGDPDLKSMMVQSENPAAMVRAALTAMIIDLMRSPEFSRSLYGEILGKIQVEAERHRRREAAAGSYSTSSTSLMTKPLWYSSGR